MQHPPVSNGRTTRPSSVVSRRFEACIQKRAFFCAERIWNFFREKVLSLSVRFSTFWRGKRRRSGREQKKDFDQRGGGEKVNDTCAPKERKKERKTLLLSLSLSLSLSRWWWWWWWWFKRRHYQTSTSSPTIRSLLFLLLLFPFFPSPLVFCNPKLGNKGELFEASLLLFSLLLLLLKSLTL